MLLFKRPPIPADFAEHVKQAKLEIAHKITQLPAVPPPAPAGTGKKKKTKKKKDFEFPDKWGKYKAVFAEAQFGKCGYCEIPVIGGQPGDVEHFAPKGEIWELDESSPGKETPFLSQVKDRKRIPLSDRGYWWLAYEWSNYLLSCMICNQAWKGAFFPVQEKPRNLPPSEAVKEVPLLLNPFGDVDPGKHLRFSALGQIEARNQSPIGLATISTCGLDRDSLVSIRQRVASRAFRLVRELSQAVQKDDQPAIERVLRDFHEMGQEEQWNAGMVRIIFEEQCGIKWKQLEKMVGDSG